jgi:hypothetical protein
MVNALDRPNGGAVPTPPRGFGQRLPGLHPRRVVQFEIAGVSKSNCYRANL